MNEEEERERERRGKERKERMYVYISIESVVDKGQYQDARQGQSPVLRTPPQGEPAKGQERDEEDGKRARGRAAG